MVENYIPEKGDIVYVDFNPTKGHEQKGYRPALVVSNIVFNKYTNMVMLCPITSNDKDFPTHYILKKTKIIKGAVLCEHIRSVDYVARNIKFVEKCNEDNIKGVFDIIDSCL